MAFSNLPKTEFKIGAKDATKGGIDSVRNRLSGLEKSFGGLGKSIGLVAAGASFKKLISSTISATDSIGKFRTATGIAVEDVQSLQFAIGQSGIGLGTFEQGITDAARVVGEAAQGFGKGKDAIRELGLDAQKLARLPVAEQFRVITEGLADVKNNTDKLRIADAIFGGAGRDIVKLGGDVRDLEAEFESLGVTLDEGAVRQGEAAADAIGRLKTVFVGTANEIGANMLPAITAIATSLQTSLPAAAEFAGKAIRNVLGVANLAFAGLFELAIKAKQLQLAPLELGESLRQLFDKDFTAPAADAIRAQIETLAALQTEILGRAAIQFGDLDAPVIEVQTFKRELVEIPTLLDNSTEAAAALDDKLSEITISAKKVAVPLTEFQSAAGAAGAGALSALEQTFFAPAEEGIKGFLNSFLTAIRRIVAQILARKFLLTLLGGPGGALASFVPGLIPGRATGGPVSGGSPYIVGERGPELMVPGTSGHIVPNNMLTGGASPSFSTTINVQSGADPQFLAQLPAILERERQRTIAAFIDLRQRNRLPA